MQGLGIREPLWERVERNRWRLAAFLAIFFAVVMGGAAISACLLGALIGFLSPGLGVARSASIAALAGGSVAGLYALACVVSALRTGEREILRRLGAERVPKGELMPTKQALKTLSLAAGFEYSPQLYLIEDDAVNAFAVGRRRESTAIGITRGFAERLGPADQRAVFANLLTRTANADIRVATFVSALMGPLWRSRTNGLRADGGETLFVERSVVVALEGDEPRGGNGGGALILLLGGVLWVIFTEVLSAVHERQAWLAAEAADAKGMLLLKDPREMLRGLERVLMSDNHVNTAGEGYSSLFYCWAGFGYAPECDPEMRRLARLREVLGPLGVEEDRYILDVDALPPTAPRVQGER